MTTAEKHRQFFSQFLEPGELVFEAGACRGKRTSIFAELGAEVVAIEPNSMNMQVLRQRFGATPNVELVQKALGSSLGSVELMQCDQKYTLHSYSADWIDAVQSSGRFGRFTWAKAEPVEMVTLDWLIDRYGVPVLICLDVEGSEYEAVRGLSVPIRMISIEWHREILEPTVLCVEYLSKLGEIKLNYTEGRACLFECKAWQEPMVVMDLLRAMPSQIAGWLPNGHVFIKKCQKTPCFSGEMNGST